MWTIAKNVAHSVVCLSVCHTGEPCQKTADPNVNQFGLLTEKPWGEYHWRISLNIQYSAAMRSIATITVSKFRRPVLDQTVSDSGNVTI